MNNFPFFKVTMDQIDLQILQNAKKKQQNVSLYMVMVSVEVATNADVDQVTEGQIMYEGHTLVK